MLTKYNSGLIGKDDNILTATNLPHQVRRLLFAQESFRHTQKSRYRVPKVGGKIVKKFI